MARRRLDAAEYTEGWICALPIELAAARRRLDAAEYTVGWICALPIELAAAQVMLDEEHLPHDDMNSTQYTLGRIGSHNVVLACLQAGQMGIGAAAFIAGQVTAMFKSIRFGMMVGVGGGVPSAKADVRLGDVVISQPIGEYSGVVQYDSGKAGKDGHTTRNGSMNAPPKTLLLAVSQLKAHRYRDGQDMDSLATNLSTFSQHLQFSREDAGPDVLFEASYQHKGEATCRQCNKNRMVRRTARKANEEVSIHYGTIASGSQVIKDAPTRDRLSKEYGGVLCFEMEAAGLMNDFPCLVVRGICDYADSHKNKAWQPYAAATAAACAKSILSLVPAVEVFKTTAVGKHSHNRLQTHADRSVATTWTISFKAVQRRNEAAANLLLLWAHLDNKNLWHGLLVKASQESGRAARRTEEWLGKMAHSKVDFMNAINILRSYSLVEEAEDLDCYSMQPAVHQWAFHMQDDSQRTALSWLAVVLVGLAVPSADEKNFWETQTRLLPHAERCETYVMTKDLTNQGAEWRGDKEKNSKMLLIRAVYCLGNLYSDRDKLDKAEKMYMLVLGNERNLSKQSNKYGLDAAGDLSTIYHEQEKFSEAIELLREVLELEKRWHGGNARQTLCTIRSIGSLYKDQGKFVKAEETFTQALNVAKMAFGEEHLETPHSLKDLGMVYFKRGKFDQAEEMFTQALRRYEKILGAGAISTYSPALGTMCNLGKVYMRLDELDKAGECYSKALPGHEKLFGKEHRHCRRLRNDIARLDRKKRDRKKKDRNDAPLLALAARDQDQQHPTTSSSQLYFRTWNPGLMKIERDHPELFGGNRSGTIEGNGSDTEDDTDTDSSDTEDDMDESTWRKGWGRKLGQKIFRKKNKYSGAMVI